eukprot:TRINITY_DN6833_c0_g1_i1.p1 TRINITY_DN6833_c0_g1~~TRINITY_DN6833_c0_g1_i1.p1  ORF type:complete len:180 (-),score=27.71 TRINITY_DN6833_c0_g1_i1:154-693(-)
MELLPEPHPIKSEPQPDAGLSSLILRMPEEELPQPHSEMELPRDTPIFADIFSGNSVDNVLGNVNATPVTPQLTAASPSVSSLTSTSEFFKSSPMVSALSHSVQQFSHLALPGQQGCFSPTVGALSSLISPPTSMLKDIISKDDGVSVLNAITAVAKANAADVAGDELEDQQRSIFFRR